MKTFVATMAALICGTIAGCSDALSPPPPEDAPAITVVYQSDPVANVHLQLHESENGPIVARAITSADGKARFVNLPNPQPTEYFVSLESVSEGGWIWIHS